MFTSRESPDDHVPRHALHIDMEWPFLRVPNAGPSTPRCLAARCSFRRQPRPSAAHEKRGKKCESTQPPGKAAKTLQAAYEKYLEQRFPLTIHLPCRKWTEINQISRIAVQVFGFS